MSELLISLGGVAILVGFVWVSKGIRSVRRDVERVDRAARRLVGAGDDDQ